MTRTRLVWCSLLASSVAACSVVSGLDDFKLIGNSESNGAGTGGAGTGGAPGAGGTAGETTSSGPSAGGGGDSSSGGGTTTTTTTTTTLAQVPCADSLCPTGEICCHNGGDATNDHCAPPGGCGDDWEMACAGPSNCAAGEACCGDRNFTNNWINSTCKPSCDGSEDLLCGGDPSVCPQAWVCEPSTQLGAGYAYCRP